jgi:hypothetical protein
MTYFGHSQKVILEKTSWCFESWLWFHHQWEYEAYSVTYHYVQSQFRLHCASKDTHVQSLLRVTLIDRSVQHTWNFDRPKRPKYMSFWPISVQHTCHVDRSLSNIVSLWPISVQHTCHFDRSVSNILVTWTTIGRAGAAAFGCRLLTIKASVQLPDLPHGTYIGHPGTRFCSSSSVSPLTNFPLRLHIQSPLIRVLEDGTVKRRSTTACLNESRK